MKERYIRLINGFGFYDFYILWPYLTKILIVLGLLNKDTVYPPAPSPTPRGVKRFYLIILHSA
jgi:hypothetical protein